MKRLIFALVVLLATPALAYENNSIDMRWKRCSNARLAPEDRIPSCTQLIRDNASGVIRAYIYLGQVYIEQRDAKSAIDIYTRAVNNYGGRIPLMLRGEAYAASGDYAHALADADAMMAIHGDEAEGLSNRCWIRGLAGQELAAGLADCDAALADRPDSASALNSRGLVLYRMGRIDEALAAYDAAVKANGKLASALHMRGVLEKKKGEPSGDADMRAALDLDPKVALALAGLGIVPP